MTVVDTRGRRKILRGRCRSDCGDEMQDLHNQTHSLFEAFRSEHLF